MLIRTTNLSKVDATPVTPNAVPRGSRSGSVMVRPRPNDDDVLQDENPHAVTSPDRRGALLSGRYATISIAALRSPQKVIQEKRDRDREHGPGRTTALVHARGVE